MKFYCKISIGFGEEKLRNKTWSFYSGKFYDGEIGDEKRGSTKYFIIDDDGRPTRCII